MGNLTEDRDGAGEEAGSSEFDGEDLLVLNIEGEVLDGSVGWQK